MTRVKYVPSIMDVSDNQQNGSMRFHIDPDNSAPNLHVRRLLDVEEPSLGEKPNDKRQALPLG